MASSDSAGGGIFTLISAPACPTKADVLAKLKPKVAELTEAIVPLTLPDFKVGR